MREVENRIVALLLGSMFVWVPNSFADGGDTVIVSLGLKEEYSDNIFYDADDEESDYITTISPEIELRRSHERTSASLKGLLDIGRYSDNDELDEVDQRYSADLFHQLTDRFYFSGDASYIRDSRSDRDIDDTGLTLGTDVRKRQRYGVDIGYVLSEKSTISAAYLYKRDDFDDPNEVDSDTNKVELQLKYNLGDWFPLTTGLVTTSYARYEDSAMEVDYYNLLFGVERQLSELFSFYADLGGRYSRSKFDAFFDDDVNFGGVAKVECRYKGEVTSGSAFFSHDLAARSGSTGGTERTSFVVSMRRRFAEKLTGRLSGGYYLNKTSRGEFSFGETDETTIRISPALTYRVTQNMNLEASYKYTHLKDKEKDDETTERNSVFIRLVMDHHFFE